MLENLTEREKIVLRRALDAYEKLPVPVSLGDRHNGAGWERAIAHDLALRIR